MRGYNRISAVTFQTNRMICDTVFRSFQWNWYQISLAKHFCIPPYDKEQEDEILHKKMMAEYKKSFEYCDKKTKLRNYMYISHKDAINLAVTSYLYSEIQENEVVLEINPGLGVLTKALLEAGVPSLRVFENKSVFLQHLRKLSESYPGRMEIIEKDFLRMPYSAVERKKQFSKFLQGITQRKWTDAPIKAFITLPTKFEKMFMKNLIYSIPKAENWYKIGRVEFFMFLSGKEYSHIIAKPKENYSRYLTASVLYSLFFDIQSFGKIERSHFFTPQNFKKPKAKQMFDNTNMYFVKMTPKSDIYNNGMTSEKLRELIHFVQICMRKRKRNILSTLEAYIPNCGPLFIKNGITFLKTFGELSPQEFLDIFNTFTSLPEYEIFKIKSDMPFRSVLCETDIADSKDSAQNKE